MAFFKKNIVLGAAHHRENIVVGDNEPVLPPRSLTPEPVVIEGFEYPAGTDYVEIDVLFTFNSDGNNDVGIYLHAENAASALSYTFFVVYQNPDLSWAQEEIVAEGTTYKLVRNFSGYDFNETYKMYCIFPPDCRDEIISYSKWSIFMFSSYHGFFEKSLLFPDLITLSDAASSDFSNNIDYPSIIKSSP